MKTKIQSNFVSPNLDGSKSFFLSPVIFAVNFLSNKPWFLEHQFLKLFLYQTAWSQGSSKYPKNWNVLLRFLFLSEIKELQWFELPITWTHFEFEPPKFYCSHLTLHNVTTPSSFIILERAFTTPVYPLLWSTGNLQKVDSLIDV